MPGTRCSLATYALGLGVVLALAAAVVVASLRGSDVRAGGAEHGDVLPILFLVLVAAALVLYVAALLTVRSRKSYVALAPLCIVAAVIQLAPLGGPLLISRDAYSYWAYGRIVDRHDADPFTVAPARFPLDPATRAVAPGWRNETSVYGTAFTYASAAVAGTVHRSANLAALVFRVTAALAAVAATLLAASIARRKSFAAVFVGWNPILALSFAGGGHNDAWMLALMLAALALIARKRDAAGGAVWILAAAIKAPALPILALELLRSRRGLWIGSALAAACVAVVSTIAFGTGWLQSIAQLDQRQARYAIPARLEQLAVPACAAHMIAYAALAVGALWLGRQAVRGRARLALGASLLLVTSPWLLPWYSTWPVALASIDDDGFAQVVAVMLCAYLLPARIPL